MQMLLQGLGANMSSMSVAYDQNSNEKEQFFPELDC